jgi:hypothetical protein
MAATAKFCISEKPVYLQLDNFGIAVIRPQPVSAVGVPNFREQDSLVAQFNEPEKPG